VSTISDGTTTITPASVTELRSAQPARTIAHEIIGGDTEYTLRDAGPRTGSLVLVFEVEADADAARAALAASAVWTFTHPDRPSAGMSFVVVGGDRSVEPDPQTAAAWTIAVPFGEVVT
jgi:hypothetical protein